MNRKDRRQLETLRRGHADAAKHVATSQAAIEDSLEVLARNDRGEVGQKPERRRQHSEGQGPNRAPREKRRPSRPGG
jgi:hypothetical protein